MTIRAYVGKPKDGMKFDFAISRAEELMIELATPDAATESANFINSQFKRCICCGANTRYLFSDFHCVECTKVCAI